MANEHTSHIESFDEARQRIDSKYAEIEQHLLEEFVKSERSNDCQRMKDLALILSNFKVRKIANITIIYVYLIHIYRITKRLYDIFCFIGIRCMR